MDHRSGRAICNVQSPEALILKIHNKWIKEEEDIEKCVCMHVCICWVEYKG